MNIVKIQSFYDELNTQAPFKYSAFTFKGPRVGIMKDSDGNVIALADVRNDDDIEISPYMWRSIDHKLKEEFMKTVKNILNVSK